MPTFGDLNKQQLYVDLVDVLNTLFGMHPGFRAAHAKALVCKGTFSPSQDSATLSRAQHFKSDVPVTVRFSNGTGVPNIPDADPNATPKGIAIRFHTSNGETDLIAHSANGFPVPTAEEFLLLLRAIAASGPGAAKPTPVEQYLGSHPRTLAYVQMPKPTPASFATENYFGLHAFRFINDKREGHFGRYFIKPVAEVKHLSAEEAAKQSPNFLFEELPKRLAKAPVQFKLFVQLTQKGDPTNDASQPWPAERYQMELGTLSLTAALPDSAEAEKKLIYDPVRLIDGIELGDDPLPLDRSGVYAVSFVRRNPD